MIFSVQRFVEDHFERRGLADVDQYAIRVANVFERLEPGATQKLLSNALSRIRTAFFRRNQELKRKEFEAQLAVTLCRRFKKKRNNPGFEYFERSLLPARGRLRVRRRSILTLLSEFKKAVEARAVDAFWLSRKKHRLRLKPEKIAQTLLAIFAKGVLGSEGRVLREFASGIGFVDVGILFATVLHLIELKILKGQFTGTNQLAAYMRSEGRNEGWLILIDSRRNQQSVRVPARIDTSSGRIRTLLVDVNPPAPHAT